jgi:1-acyl-sn-glycerol-3-phosphate acyltransferase
VTSAHLLEPPVWAVNGLYSAARPGVEWLARRVLDVDVTGREHMPARGPVVMAGNHLSFIDPVMMSMAARRNVRFMAVGFIFNQSKMFDRLISFFGAIPTARDVLPIRAVRRAVRELENGEVVGLFPEGRRVAFWGEEQPARGAAWLALATGAALVPVPMQGAQHTLGIVETGVRRTAVRIWIEPPLDPLDYGGHADPVGAMMEDWRAAMDARLAPWWRDVPQPGAGALP